MNGKRRFWVLTAFVVLAIAWLTLSPKPFGTREVKLFPNADKIAHAIMFGVLTICLLFSMNMRWVSLRKGRLVRAAIAGALSLAYGVGIEVMQEIMHRGRTFDLADIWADAVGCVLAAVIWIRLCRCG